jgi:glycine/D-amino acid oxidase-like deaminating enzyme
MQNDSRSHGLWEKSAPPAPETASLTEAVACDVVILGGGFTGLSTALHLAQAGTSVVVLEGKEIGFGGSGRNVGLVNAGMWVMPEDLPDALGQEYGDRLLALLGNGPSVVWSLVEKHKIECEATRNGTLHCAVGSQGLKEITERQRQWSKLDAPVQLLDAKEASLRIGTNQYQGALHDARAGTIQPLAYARGLAKAAMGAGATIYTQSAVVSAKEERTRWHLATDKGTVTASTVVVATDAYTIAPWPEIRREQVHLPYFNFATHPLSDNLRKSILPGGEGCWDTKNVLSSFRFDKAGRLIFGSVGALRGTGTSIHRNWTKRMLARIFPQITEVEFETEWYGMIGMTTDNLPRFHRLARNVFSFCGYNGRGIAPGTVFGKTMAEFILEQINEAELPLPMTTPDQPAFRAAKEAYYEIGAQMAHLASSRF